MGDFNISEIDLPGPGHQKWTRMQILLQIFIVAIEPVVLMYSQMIFLTLMFL